MKLYVLVKAAASEKLEEEVNKMIEEGFEPLGGPVFTNDGVFVQAMLYTLGEGSSPREAFAHYDDARVVIVDDKRSEDAPLSTNSCESPALKKTKIIACAFSKTGYIEVPEDYQEPKYQFGTLRLVYHITGYDKIKHQSWIDNLSNEGFVKSGETQSMDGKEFTIMKKEFKSYAGERTLPYLIDSDVDEFFFKTEGQPIINDDFPFYTDTITTNRVQLDLAADSIWDNSEIWEPVHS